MLSEWQFDFAKGGHDVMHPGYTLDQLAVQMSKLEENHNKRIQQTLARRGRADCFGGRRQCHGG